MAPSISASARSIARVVRHASVRMAARSISTPSRPTRGTRPPTGLPLPPEFIAPGTGAGSRTANAMPRSAGWSGMDPRAPLRPNFLGDDLFAVTHRRRHQRAGGKFLLRVQNLVDPSVTEYLDGADLNERRQRRRRPRQADHHDLPMALRRAMRNTKDALIVNWFSVEILNNKGKPTSITASSPICRSPPARWPTSPPVAARDGRSRTRRSMC